MKRFLMLLAALLLALTPVLAEEVIPVPEEVPAEAIPMPVEIMPQTEGLVFMAEAIEKAQASMAVLPADCLTRAELVRMSDGSHLWIVIIFDLSNFADGWCITVDAFTGSVLTTDVTHIGYFQTINARWQAAKGVEALWSLTDKQLFDTLYTMQPAYGLPMEGDIAQGEALVKAMAAVGVTNASDYDVGYGYLMSAGEENGMWEVFFVQEGEVIYKVNLDAVNGDVLLIEPDEEGNG